MTSPWTDVRWNRTIFLLLIAFIWACGDGGDGCDIGCDDDGCGGGLLGGGDYTYPEDAPTIRQSAQLRLTQNAFDFLSENREQLIATFLDDGDELSVCIPPLGVIGQGVCVSGDRRACPDDEPGCYTDITIDDLEIEPVAPQSGESGRLAVRAKVSSGEIPYRIGTTCYLQLKELPATLHVVFRIDPETDRTHISVPTDGANLIIDANDQTVDADAREQNILGFIPTCFLQSGLINLIRDIILEVALQELTPLIDDALCVQCGDGDPCDAGYFCVEGVCREGRDDIDPCQPVDLGLDLELDLGDLLADISPGLEARVGLSAWLANYAETPHETNPGVDLALEIGAYPETFNPCVPWVDPPGEGTYPKSSQLNASMTPGFPDLNVDPSPFMVGIGLSRTIIDRVLWSAYASGALCLGLTSADVEQITSSTFGLLLSSLSRVTLNRNRKVLLQLAPNEPPYVELGRNIVTDGRLVEPLLQVRLDNLDVDFYVWIWDRFKRVFTLNVDAAIPLGIEPVEGGLELLLGELTEAFTRVEGRNGELLDQADLASLSSVLPRLIGAVEGQLGDLLDEPIELPDLAGLELVINEDSITSVDDGDLLAIFASIAFADRADLRAEVVPELLALSVAQPTLASIEQTRARALAADELLPPNLLTPRVELQLAARVAGSAAADAEFSYRLNGGIWSTWRSGPTLTLEDPRLGASGRHLLEVRARLPGTRWNRSTASLARVEVPISWIAPDLELVERGGVLVPAVGHPVFGEEALEMRVRFEGGAWQGWQPVDEVMLGEAIRQVEIEVRDPRGNTTAARHERKRVDAPHAEAERAASPRVGGCAAVPSGGAGGSVMALLLLAGMVFRRRRLARPLLIAIAALTIGACSSSSGTTPDGSETSGTESAEIECDDERPCPSGEVCVEGVCVPPEEPECRDSEDCPFGEACVENECVSLTCDGDGDCAALHCPDGEEPWCGPDGCFCGGCPDGCEEGRYCCAQTGRCEALPDPCDGFGSCPTGQEPGVIVEPQGFPGTCEVQEGECACVDLPPLRQGDIGRNLGTAVSAQGDVLVITAYNGTYNDLMLGVARNADEIEWEYLLGPPATGPVTGALSGPRGGIATPGSNVGDHSSVTFDANGLLHIAFSEEGGPTGGRLQYGRGAVDAKGDDWTFFELDATPFSGRYTETFLDAQGRVNIIYAATRVYERETQRWFAELRMARAKVAEPAGPEDFDFWVLDRVENEEPCAGECPGSGQRCREDVNACGLDSRRGCDPSCPEGTRCYESLEEEGVFTCSAEVALPAYLGPLRALIHPSVAILEDGGIAVAYFDAINGDLRMLQWQELPEPEEAPEESGEPSGGQDSQEEGTPDGEEGGEPSGDEGDPVDPSGDDTPGIEMPTPTILAGSRALPEGGREDLGRMGAFPHLLVDGFGDLFVSFVDQDTSTLVVLDVGARTIQVIDDGIRVSGAEVRLSRVGEDSVLREGPGGLMVYYQDATRLALMRSSQGAQGWSEPEGVFGLERGADYVGAAGFFSRFAETSFGDFVVQHRLDHTQSPIRRDVVLTPR